MSKPKKHKKRIREIKFAIDLMNEDPEFYETILGSKENLQKWVDFQLRELQIAIDALSEEE